MSAAETSLRDIVAGHFLPGAQQRIGVAVSGGGDSLALLHLLAEVAQTAPITVHAVTVDHALRPGSRAEAMAVAQIAAGLGLSHDTLTWTGWDGQGNLQDRARRARYGLIADWAVAQGITEVALGHTADDQAETFLMRLARSAGVDGLSGMPVRRPLGPVTLVRPLLGQSRASLRHYLTQRGVVWAEDPSNDDTRFERVRIRHALEQLQPLGLTTRALCDVAANLDAVRGTLSWYAHAEAQEITTFDAGDVIFSRFGFDALQPEIARRLLAQALVWISGTDYPPRRRSLALALDMIRAGTDTTLHGCKILVAGKNIRVAREYAAVKALVTKAGQTWDGRWRIEGPWSDRDEVRALGDSGLSQLETWRDSGLPHGSLSGYPSVWRGDTLVAVPHAGFGERWSAKLLRGADAYFSGLLAH